MKNLMLLTGLLCCMGGDYKKEIKSYQKELDAAYKSAQTSPLSEQDRKKFKGHSFFHIDQSYRVEARFVRTADAKPFKMETSTTRLPDYVVYGRATFELNGQTHHLNIYQSLDLIKLESYRDHLFLPFTDLTSGGESYGGGRYIDLTIPDGDMIVIDFNKAYNPYCAYSSKYSCPIPPPENRLAVAIEAGVKNPH